MVSWPCSPTLVAAVASIGSVITVLWHQSVHGGGRGVVVACGLEAEQLDTLVAGHLGIEARRAVGSGRAKRVEHQLEPLLVGLAGIIGRVGRPLARAEHVPLV